ncbi:MAG: hypothetical protein JW760_01870 [Spirochaetales bacterium]|nr:hypothetical protein [Spirochaetales bacterium]
MNILELEESLFQGKDYDLFPDSCPVDDELLSRHLVPPLPKSGKTLVWGHALVRRAGELGLKDLPSVEIQGDEMELLSLALRLEGRRDGFSLKEKGEVYSFLEKKHLLSRSDEVIPLIQSDGSFLMQAKKYLELPGILKESVDTGYMDLKTAGMLTGLDTNILKRALEIFSSGTFSQRRTALVFMREISIRDSLSSEKLLKLLEEMGASEDPFHFLEALRYPRLTEMRRDFKNFSSRLLEGSGIQLTEPPGFEGKGFSVSFQYTGKKQLGRVLDTLARLREESDELFKLLR